LRVQALSKCGSSIIFGQIVIITPGLFQDDIGRVLIYKSYESIRKIIAIIAGSAECHSALIISRLFI
jgi:hypothetical protein